jgi:hypothetical protein
MNYRIFIAYVLVLTCLFPARLLSQTFTEVPTTIPALIGSSDWGDVDSDAYLDVIITGTSNWSPWNSCTYICMNDGNGQFTTVNIPNLPPINNGTARWIDFNNDGMLDIFLSGLSYNPGTQTYVPVAKLFMGKGDKVFELMPDDSEKTQGTSFDWADLNNDGSADIALSGYTDVITGVYGKVYENRNNSYTASAMFNIKPLYCGSMQWGDYDGDSDLDLIQSGLYLDEKLHKEISKTYIYRNDVDSFALLKNTGIIGVSFGSTEWGDYDSDGDLGILLTGQVGMGSDATGYFRVYRNDGNDSFHLFTIADEINHVYRKSKWGDYDNDGDLDILVSGDYPAQPIGFTYIYKNNNGIFSKAETLCDVIASSLNWVDFDNDKDLDVFLLGYVNHTIKSKLFRNNAVQHNSRPEAPAAIHASVNKKKVHFSWSRGSDLQTNKNGLSYNLSVGALPTSSEQMEPNSFLASGNRKLVRLGNMSMDTCWDLTFDLKARYFWQVQSIDNSFAGSFFSEAGSFVIGSPMVLTEDATEINITDAIINGKVNPMELNTEVFFEFGTDSINLTELSTSLVLQGDSLFEVKMHVLLLVQNTTYYYRIKAINDNDTLAGELLSFRTAIDGIADNFREIIVFPNPCSDIIHFGLPYLPEGEIRIFDNTGRKRMQINTKEMQNPNSIDVRKLETGIYTLILNAGKYSYHCRIEKW